MSDTWSGKSSTSWFTTGNWSGNAYPTISATGSQTVVISGSISNQPTISPRASGATDIYVAQTLTTDGQDLTSLLETQIGGELITLTNSANLTIQGIAMGVFYGDTDTITAAGGTISGLHGATSSTPSYDTHMELIALGTDTLTVDTINENFGLITIGSSDTLTIANITTGGNQQALHGLINYGLITVASGGDLNITATNGTATNGPAAVANFYNAGWIVDNGGTLNISSTVLDGANTAASATSIDGYIELEGGANAILSNTVASHEEVLFADTAANTLQITAGTLFGGTVAGFGSTDTIIVNSFTGTSNATLVANGNTTSLVTANGSVLTTITLAGTLSGVATGTNSSAKQEFIVLNGGTLSGSTLSGGTTFSSGTVSLGGTSTPTLTLSGTVGVTGSGTDAQVNSSLGGSGTLFVDNGATLALDNPTGTDAGVTVQFGTHGSASAPNTLILNDNASGFGGKVTSFGLNDEIVIGSKVLAQPSAGTGLALSYSSGVLTVEDTSNSTGSIVSSTNLTISGTAALSTASFVALESGSGIEVELAPTAATSFTFSTSGTGSFEQASNFSGGTAPGDIITSYETVSIAKGTASISSGGVSENGLITVASGAKFVDNGSLSGTGTLVVGSGGAATLLGSTTLASISDTGTLVLGGSDAAAITLASGAQATITSNFSDTHSITGAGTLTVNSGVTATLAGGSSIASIIDAGTLDLAGAMGGAINMQGNGAKSVVDFTGSSSSATLTNFGTTDDIILGTGMLPAPTSGTSIALGYSGGVLTVTEGTSSAHVTVSGVSGTTLSAASFVALQGTNGENIELASGLAGQTFAFSTSGTGSFETPANYAGGVAPGDSIVAGEVVTITAGTASVTGSALVDNGTINVGTGFVDASGITGTGTLNIGTVANATLTGNTTLGSISDAGTLVLGGTDAAAISLASGAQATIASKFSDTGSITGAGTLTVNSGVTATLAAGSSVASIIDAGTLNLAGAMGGAINMQGNSANSVADFTGTDVTGHVLNTALINFGTTDKIILGSSNFSLSGTTDKLTDSYNNGTLVVTDTTDGASVTLDLSLTSGDQASWLQLGESTGQLVLTLCFYPGTRIATPEGDVAVEALQAGDLVATGNGPKPVRWVGQSHVHTRFADPLRSLPIRIKAGALGDGLPARDLLLSPDHAVFIDGILVQAGALVNGSSIVREQDVPEQFTYYHVELATHELLLAEGVQAESFVDNVDRVHFHNWDEREAPAEPIEEMTYPRAKAARQVPMATRHRLNGMAANAA